MRALYRVRQFGQYLAARLGPAERAAVARQLGPRLAALFGQMSPAEQAHSYRVAQTLIAQGHTEPDLLLAALLHDVGKTRAPLNIFERTLAVLGRRLAPEWAGRWGQAEAERAGLRRAFVTAQQHAAWGADMAERAGAPPRAAWLIRQHQTAPTAPPQTEDDRLLHLLRAADEAN